LWLLGNRVVLLGVQRLPDNVALAAAIKLDHRIR
jgi:hypothetical protein